MISQPSPSHTSRPLSLQMMPASARPTALAIWRELESRLDNRRLMCSSVWTETWLNHFGGLVPHQFAVAFRDQSATGICLLTNGVGQRNGPMRTQTFHLGTSGEPEADAACVEYNSLLVTPGDRNEFQQEIWNWMNLRTDWDELRLDGFSETELSSWPLTDRGWSVTSKPACYFDSKLARESGAEILSLLGTHTRSSIRRNLRRAGPIEFQWAETIEQAQSIFNELVKLHQIRWNSVGLPGCYSSHIFRSFHEELLCRLVPLGSMGLFRVRNQNGTIGCDQVLIDQNRACIYQGGRVLPTDYRISTGVIVDYYLIEECRRRGFDAIDFLAGDSPHKRRLSTHQTPLIWAVYRRPSLKHGLVDGLRKFKRAIQHSLTSQYTVKPSNQGQNARAFNPDSDSEK